MDFIHQSVITRSVVGLRKSSKTLPKTKLAPLPKKRPWSLLVVSYWSDPLPLSEFWQDHYIWEVCSPSQWDARKLHHLQPALVSRVGPVLLHDSQPHAEQPLLQLNKFSYEVLPHPPYSPDLLPTNYHFFKHVDSLLQGICFHNLQDVENAF